jgi:hypothetical protein
MELPAEAAEVSHGPDAPLTLPRSQARQVKLVFVDVGRVTVPIKLDVDLHVIAADGPITDHACGSSPAPSPHSVWEFSREISTGDRDASFGAEVIVVHRIRQRATPRPTAA